MACGHSKNKTCKACRLKSMKQGGWLDNLPKFGNGTSSIKDSVTMNPELMPLPENSLETKGIPFEPFFRNNRSRLTPEEKVKNISTQDFNPHDDFRQFEGNIAPRLSEDQLREKYPWVGMRGMQYDKYYDNTFTLKDDREKRLTTGKDIVPTRDLTTGKYNKPLVESIVKEGKAKGLKGDDLWNLVAIGLQETNLGKADDNIGHTLGYGDRIDGLQFIDAYRDKLNLARREGVTNDTLALQYYNGLGIITPDTEKNYHGYSMDSIYGVPIPEEGINMKESKLYGKEIIDKRDNILKKNEYLRSLIEDRNTTSINDYVSGKSKKKNGGWLDSYGDGGPHSQGEDLNAKLARDIASGKVSPYKKPGVPKDGYHNISALQEMLVEQGHLDNKSGKAIDNIWGPNTKAALESFLNDNEGISGGQLPRGIGEIPLNVRALINDLTRNLKPITNQSVGKEGVKVTQDIVRKNLKKGKNFIEYGDYNTGTRYGDVGGGEDPLKTMGKAYDPNYNLKTTAGQARIVTTPTDTFLLDRYNFNDARDGTLKTLASDIADKPNPYGIARSFGRNFGSKEGEGAPMLVNTTEGYVPDVFKNGGWLDSYEDGEGDKIKEQAKEDLDTFTSLLEDVGSGAKWVADHFAGLGPTVDAVQSAVDLYGDIQKGDWETVAKKGAIEAASAALPYGIGKATKTVRKQLTKHGVKGIEDIWKVNPLAEKLNDPNLAYRATKGEGAYQDYLKRGVVGVPDKEATEALNALWKAENPNSRFILNRQGTTPRPSFKKGKVLEEYGDDAGTIFVTDLPVKKIRRGGHGVADFPYDPITEKALKEVPAENIVGVYSFEPHWLKGYQKKKNGGWLDSYQDGGDLPTRTDSLNLLNNSLALQDYYSAPYMSSFHTGKQGQAFSKNKKEREFIEQMIAQGKMGVEDNYSEFEEKGDRPLAMGDYYKKVGPYTYKQRELNTGELDLEAPMQLFDTRITPTGRWDATNIVPFTRGTGDIVNFYTYDPISVTPWDMLSPEQKVERRKKYGDAGTPYSSPVKPATSQKEQKREPVPKEKEFKADREIDGGEFSKPYIAKEQADFLKREKEQSASQWRITEQPKPEPEREPVPTKMKSRKAKIPFKEQSMPTTGSVLPFINDIYGGKMSDEYVRLSNLTKQGLPSGDNYAIANFPGEAAKGMSQEEYVQYFLNKGKKKTDNTVAQKKNGGWLDNL